jgi:hypothetical protein
LLEGILKRLGDRCFMDVAQGRNISVMVPGDL